MNSASSPTFKEQKNVNLGEETSSRRLREFLERERLASL